MATVIEKKKFICADSRDNHNKWWAYSLYDNDDVKVEWGRIGKGTQSKLHGGVGKHFADSKVREKLNKGYKEVNILDVSGGTSSNVKVSGSIELKTIARNQIKHKNPTVSNLIDFLVTVNRHDIHKATGGQITWNADDGAFKTPLGFVEPTSIATARTLLVDLGDYVAAGKYKNAKFLNTLEEYLTLIPQDIGMKFDPKAILPDLIAVQKQGSILDALEASYQAISIPSVNSNKKASAPQDAPKVFDVELEEITDRDALKSIRELYEKTAKSMHVSSRYKVKCIYLVEMPSQKARFDSVAKELKNVKRLWHGTSSSNLLSILKSGLKKSPPSSAYVSGKMFGGGTYFSSESTKSLNYACGYWGGDRSSRTFMFLADVALGNYYVPKGPTSKKPPNGYHSYWAKPRESGVLNNEMVIFDDNQCLLKYLVEFV